MVLTIVLGLAFLGIKFYEYHTKFEEHLVPGSSFRFEASLARPAEIFFSFYFAMTGMHAVHMIIGIGLLTALIVQARRGRFSALLSYPRRANGSLLAFRRYRVDFSVPLTLLTRAPRMKSEPVVPVKVYALVFLALLALTAVTTAVAFFDLGGGMNNAIALTIAVCKAVLVILYFMHVRYSDKLTWVFAAQDFSGC